MDAFGVGVEWDRIERRRLLEVMQNKLERKVRLILFGSLRYLPTRQRN